MAPAYGSPYRPTTSMSPYGPRGIAALQGLDPYNQKRLNLPLTRAKTGGRMQNNTLQDALMRLIR